MYKATCHAKDKAHCRTHGVAAKNKRYKIATGAALQVLNNKKDFRAAVEVPGLGEIDFRYGKPGTPKPNSKGVTYSDGYEISHIVAKHGTRALHRMPYVLAHGKVEPHENKEQRYIRLGSEIAIVKHVGGSRWELTTFYDEHKDEQKDDMYISTTTKEERDKRK